MMMKRGQFFRRLPVAAVLLAGGSLIGAAPALARGWIEIPEPADLTLFALGLAGLIIGRWGAKRRPRD